jgi:hypothetical protein
MDNTINDGYPAFQFLYGATTTHAAFTDNTPTGKRIGLQIEGDCDIQSLSVEGESANATKDIAFDYVNGMVHFTLNNCNDGTTVIVKLVYYDTTASNVTVRKYNSSLGSYTTIGDASIETVPGNATSSMMITYTLKDGGQYDSDGTANGTITDPVGAAIAAIGAPRTGGGGTAD